MIYREYIVNCPICGKTLFKSLSADKIAVQCPKCRQDLIVSYLKGILSVSEQSIVKAETDRK